MCGIYTVPVRYLCGMQTNTLIIMRGISTEKNK